MKSFVLLLAILCISIACKKENTNFSSFDLDLANPADSIYYDSVAYAIINYSDLSEIKDSIGHLNPDVFNHSEKVEKRSPYNIYSYGFTVKSGHSYVIKGFNLLSKSGNVIFYIPYGTQYYFREGIQYKAPLTLPFHFKAFSGGMMGLYITRN
jgi:hypothetical protein